MKIMAVLTSKQRQYLRGLAHPLAPVVRVGQGRRDGVRDRGDEEVAPLARADQSAHRSRRERRAAKRSRRSSPTAADAQLAGTVGKVAILYRARDEEPEIKLPE